MSKTIKQIYLKNSNIILIICSTYYIMDKGTSNENPSGWHRDVEGILVLHCTLITQIPLKRQETGKNGKWRPQDPLVPGHVVEA